MARVIRTSLKEAVNIPVIDVLESPLYLEQSVDIEIIEIIIIEKIIQFRKLCLLLNIKLFRRNIYLNFIFQQGYSTLNGHKEQSDLYRVRIPNPEINDSISLLTQISKLLFEKWCCQI